MKDKCMYVLAAVLASVLALGTMAQDDSCFSFDRGDQKKIVDYDGSCTKDVVIPDGTTSIDSYAFDDRGLVSLTPTREPNDNRQKCFFPQSTNQVNPVQRLDLRRQ